MTTDTTYPGRILPSPVTAEAWLEATEADIAALMNAEAEARAIEAEREQRALDVLTTFCTTGFGHGDTYVERDASGSVEAVVCSTCETVLA